MLVAAGAAVIATLTDPEAEVLCWLVAVTVTVAGEGAALGAVYNPAEVMVPQVLPLHPPPLTVQETAVFVVPETEAVNCCVDWVWRLTPEGVTVTVTVGALLSTSSLAVFETRANDAVSVAAPADRPEDALTVKAALALRAATVTEAGTETPWLLLVKVTVSALGAALLRLTVQVALPGDAILLLEQDSALRAGV